MPIQDQGSGQESGAHRAKDPVVRVALYSILVNLSLVLVKFGLAALSGSMAIRADAVHSFVDILGSVALLFGLRLSSRKSEQFPYGLYKVENVVSIMISLLLFLTAYEIIREALFAVAAPLNENAWVIVAVALLIPVPFLFGRYEVAVGRKSHSPGLVADGSQFMTDVLSSTIVFAGLIGQFLGIPLDRAAAAIVALFIVRAGWQILKDGMRVLLDAAVDPETLRSIRGIIEEEPAVTAINSLFARNSGRYIFIEVDLALRVTELNRAHQITARIEDRIKAIVPTVDHVMIHYEPPERSSLRYVIPLGDLEGIICSHFGSAPFFALFSLDTSKGVISDLQYLKNPFRTLEHKKGIKTAEFLMQYKPDVVITTDPLSGTGPGYAFAEAGIEVRIISAGSLHEVFTSLGGVEKNHAP